VETELPVISRPVPPKPAAAAKFKVSRKFLVSTLVGGAIGAGIGFLGTKFGGSLLLPGLPKPWGLMHLLLLPFYWLVAVAFHELGHLAGGWMGGGRFLIYVVGPFMWKRSPAGVSFSWNTNVNTFGGLAGSLPIDPARCTPHSTALMVAGGPIFSLVLGSAAAWLAAALASIAVAPGASSGIIFLQHMAAITALMSYLIFAVTVFPATGGGFKTDGLRFIELLNGDQRSAQENAMMALTTASLGGVRPADYDPQQVATSISLGDRSLFDLYAHLTVAHHFIDVGQPGRAQQLLDYVLTGEELLAPFLRDTLRCDYAWLLARYTNDAPTARAWLDSAGPLDIDPATRLRAEAAVLLAEGRRAEAAAKAREGLHAAEHKSLSPVRNAYVIDTIEEILRRAEAA